MVNSTAEVMQNYNYQLFRNFKYGKCSKTDLIINSGSGLASKVIGPFSSHCSEKDKSDTLFSGIEFMTSDSCTSDSCHASCPVSFLYFLYKLDRILSVKTLGNPLNLACQSRYSGVNILSVLVMLPFSIIANQSN